MSEAGDIIARLTASGANYQDIGQAVGRNRSLIRQIDKGVKPGRNLVDALHQLENALHGGQRGRALRQVQVSAPERRTTSRGALAKVRRPTTVRGRNWSASTVKKSAARHGARGLQHALADAAEDGKSVAVTVAFDRSITVQLYGKSRRGRAGAGGVIDIELGDAGEVLDAILTEHDGSVSDYLVSKLEARGLISGREPDQHMVSIDMRTY